MMFAFAKHVTQLPDVKDLQMRRVVFVIGLSLVPFVLPAKAAVLFDTINGTTQGAARGRLVAPGNWGTVVNGALVTLGGPLAVSFSAPYETDIAQVSLKLFANTPGDGGSVMVYLVPDAAGSPSNNGLTGTNFQFSDASWLGTIADSAIISDAVYTFATNVHINPGQYWLGAVNIAGTVTGTARWDYTTNWTSGIGATGQKDFGQYGPGVLGTPLVWGAGDTSPAPAGVPIAGLFMAQVVDTPEPTTLAILGAGLAGLGLAGRRRRNGLRAIIKAPEMPQ